MIYKEFHTNKKSPKRKMGKEYKQAIYSKYSFSISIEKVPTWTRSKNSQIAVANYVSD